MNKSIDKNNIYKNAIITYYNGYKEMFDAIAITNQGIYTGIIRKNKNNNEEFIDGGLVTKETIKKIILVDESGNLKNIDFSS